jgi:tetratricopeptide (TPR) repeat protein
MADAQLLVEIDLDGEPVAAAGPGLPMGAGELEDLRWYLEDYLQTPFGVYSDRGSRIAGHLVEWGRALFSSAFGPDRIREKYAGLRAQGSAEIVLRSAAPEWLGLPWELMRDPDASAPLVLEGMGISRCLEAGPAGSLADTAGERLRVLMVISRPAGTRDVGYQMIARPLLRSIASAGGQVDLEVLRPSTLEALGARLREAREAGTPFQIAHFDGHGVAAGEGALVFEKSGGGPDYVTAGRLAEVLAAANVPVAVLNACQSGAIGKRLEATVATGLLSGGVCAVVAMSYRVYAVAAAEFMTAFYDQLIGGGTVSESVRAGRSRMARHPGRPSPKGELPLEDWLVPVYYRSREVRFPQLRAAVSGTGEGEAPESPPAYTSPPASAAGTGQGGDPLEPEEEFVGRDDLFCTLETAARTDRVVLLHGSGGTGKTELAKAFGRWWRDTGGVDRPDDVFWHSFEPSKASLGLDGAILETGLRLRGPEFALKDPGTRRDLVLEQLRARRLLLVWDNFESVASMLGDVTGPPDARALGELKGFLREAAAGGGGMILVTSRTPESWLGDVRRVAVDGLPRHEAVEYADQVLAPFPAAATRRADRSFAELLEWLDGHPLSMRVILPHLATAEPAALLSGLQATEPLPVAEHDTGMRSLTASVGYSIVHLSAAGRRLLVALSLFHGVADVDVLGAFSVQGHAPQRFRGVSADEWDMVLDEAARLGLLTTRATGGYGIHPALPAYLAAQWRAEEPGIYPDARAAADRALLDACAAASEHWGRKMDAEASTDAYAFIDRNRATMGRMLGYALDNRLWSAAQSLFITLRQYLDHGGLEEEARCWADRARCAVEGPGGLPAPGDLPAFSLKDPQDLPVLSAEEQREYRSALSLWSASIPAFSLWDVVVLSQANRLMRAGDLDAAEACYREILRMKENVPGLPPTGLALTYGKLGFVAEGRGRFAEAEEIYRKALAIYEEAGDRQEIAESLRHLGSVAQVQGRWDEAEQHYQKALAILKEIAGNVHSTQLTFDELGHLAEARGRLGEAEKWYDKSLALAEQRHDWDGTARSLHSLGKLSRRRGQVDEAERWYHRCLTLAESVHDRPGMAATYHELGFLALMRGQDEAEQWFRRSLDLHQDLGSRASVSRDYRMLGLIAIARHQMEEAERLLSESLAIEEDIAQRDGIIECYHLLGGLAHQRGRWDEAEQWLRKTLAIEEEMGHETGVAVSCFQLGMVAEARGHAAEALEWTVRSTALEQRSPDFGNRDESHRLLGRLTGRLGTGALEEYWERVTGDSLPPEIRQLAVLNQRAEAPPDGP